jgi:hypothetical protein
LALGMLLPFHQALFTLHLLLFKKVK